MEELCTEGATYQLEAIYTVLDVPLDQGLQLGGLEGVGVGGLALHPLVPGHHIIPEEHAQYVSNAAVVRYACLKKQLTESAQSPGIVDQRRLHAPRCNHDRCCLWCAH